MGKNERIYTPNCAAGWGLKVWLGMAEEVVSSWELTWRLFLRDFSARYRQTVLGVTWAIIPPIIVVGTFVILNQTGILNVESTVVPYPVYALLGLSVWQLFAGGLTACSNAIIAGGPMVVKINFPKETLVIAAIGQTIFEFFVRLIMLAILMLIYQTAPKWTAVFFPLIVLPVVLFTLGLGLILSFISVIVRDVVGFVSLATTFLMFLTPVLYPAPPSALFARLMIANPMAGLISASRDIVFTGYLTNLSSFIWAAVASMILLLLAWRIFHLVEFKMGEVV
jgi:lipopolysaccharide transport system permease protein